MNDRYNGKESFEEWAEEWRMEDHEAQDSGHCIRRAVSDTRN